MSWDNKPKKLPGGQQDQEEGYQQPYWDQNSIFLLKIDPIPFLGLDLIDPQSSLSKLLYDFLS